METVMPPQTHLQGNMQVPDELLALFNRNLSFNPELQAAMASEQAQQQQLQQIQEATPSQPVYSASQHYTHSYHVAKPRSQDVETQDQQQQNPFQRSCSAPLENDAYQAEALLRSHGVEPSLLTPSQLQLFRTAEDAQKLRLLELWSICPPNGAQNIPALAWSSTTLEQEEHLARVRYQRDQQLHEQLQEQQAAAAIADAMEQQQQQQQQPSMEQSATGQWTQPAESEPYMSSGYEELMRRENERASAADRRVASAYCHFGNVAAYNKAVDPIYLGPDFVREQQQMEMAAQYGAFEQFRGGDVMDVM